MTDKIVVFTTCATDEEAGRIARHLVERRLAACVNIAGGVSSVYRWKDAVETASEVLMAIKTSRSLFDEVRAAIGREHSYDVPECIALPIIEGGPAYMDWLEQALKRSEASPR